MESTTTAIIAAAGVVGGGVLTHVVSLFRMSSEDRRHERETNMGILSRPKRDSTQAARLDAVEQRLERLESNIQRELERIRDAISGIAVQIGKASERDHSMSNISIPGLTSRCASLERRVSYAERSIAVIEGHLGMSHSGLTPVPDIATPIPGDDS